MKTLFVNKKSEVTATAANYNNCQAYRTRLTCHCREGQNRRDGILIVDNNIVVTQIVRCKTCRKEASHE